VDDGTYRLTRNVGTELLLNAVQYPKRGQI